MKKLFSKLDYNSPFILTFFFLALAAQIGQTIFGMGFTNQFFTMGHVSLMNPFSILTIFTSILGHASWDHFLGNFLIILILGPMLEEKYGTFNLIVLTIINALLTGAVHIIFSNNTALLGASGVAFMLILLSSFASVKDKTIPITLILVAILYMGQELFQINAQDHVAHFAHLIGGVVGIFGGLYLNGNRKF